MNLATAHRVLSRVLLQGEYVHLAFAPVDNDPDKAWTRKVVYGTLERYYELNAVLHALSPRPPKPTIRVLLLLSAYVILYLDVPPYAVVNDAVTLADTLKRGTAGYVNALLRRVAQRDYHLPEQGSEADEIRYNLPAWIIRRVRTEYPDCADAILQAPVREEEHVRLRTGVDRAWFEGQFPQAVKTPTGYYLRMTPQLSELFRKGLVTVQGYNSTLAVLAFGPVQGKKFLDVAAAPGGKAVFAAERGALVTACDLHPHRVELIKKYSARMRVPLKAELRDATRFYPPWQGAFDCVLVDAPCSGLGVINRRRDSVFRREEEEIEALHATQVAMLLNAARYVRVGGTLVYSTCTILHRENQEVVAALAGHGFEGERLPFAPTSAHTFLPQTDSEGFFIARFRRVREEAGAEREQGGEG